MKYYINFFFFAFVLLLSSCDNEGDIADFGYYTFQMSFIYPEEAQDDHRIVFNGEDIRAGTNQYISRKNNEGKLQVYDKEKGSLLYSQEIMIQEDQQRLQLIKLPGKEIDLYSEDTYVGFLPTILFSGDASLFTTSFNGQELVVNKTNYLSIDNLKGNLQIIKKGESDPIYSQEFLIEPNSNINIMQLSETEFITVPEDDEPAPETRNLGKVRFFYNDAFSSSSAIRVDFYYFDEYTWDWASELPLGESVVLKKSELSSYIEFNVTKESGLTSIICDVYDLDNEEFITHYLENYNYGPLLNSKIHNESTHKFSTWQMGGETGFVTFKIIEALSTRW